LSPCQGEFANGLTQANWLSQVIFQFFGWIIVMAFTFIFSLILWLMIGNILYYMQVFVLRQKNPQVNFSPVVRSQSFNVSDLFSLVWSRGREGIRVSLSDELTGGDGVFSD
jgi:Amt family ammonium transporter